MKIQIKNGDKFKFKSKYLDFHLNVAKDRVYEIHHNDDTFVDDKGQDHTVKFYEVNVIDKPVTKEEKPNTYTFKFWDHHESGSSQINHCVGTLITETIKENGLVEALIQLQNKHKIVYLHSYTCKINEIKNIF